MELLVVIALLTIILSVSLFNYDNFGKDVELENAVYSVALATREAQVFGVNKRAREHTGDPKEFFGEDYGYGVFFSKVASGSTYDNKKFVIFIDKNNNKKFTVGSGCVSGEECYSQISLEKGNRITNIKGYNLATGWVDIDNININFKRPNPDATINTQSGTVYSRAKIIIKDNTDTYTRCMEVGSAGDISIKANC